MRSSIKKKRRSNWRQATIEIQPYSSLLQQCKESNSNLKLHSKNKYCANKNNIMKNKYKYIVSISVSMALASPCYADKGNSLLFPVNGNGTSPVKVDKIALDRIQLAAMSPQKRNSLLSAVESNYGEGKIGSDVVAHAETSYNPHDPHFGSLRAPSLDVAFAPLDASTHAKPKKLNRRENRDMAKIKKGNIVYPVSESSGSSSAGKYSEGILSNRAATYAWGCKQDTSGGYHRSSLWEAWAIQSGTITFATEFEVWKKVFGGAELKQITGVSESTTLKRIRMVLYDNHWIDGDGIAHGKGRKCADYWRKTINTAGGRYVESSVKIPIDRIKIEGEGFHSRELNVFYKNNIWRGAGRFWQSQEEDTGTASQEQYDSTIYTNDAGVEVKVQRGSFQVALSVVLRWEQEHGNSNGIRDFDYYCLDGDPQWFLNKGYYKNTMKLVAAAEYKYSTFKVKVSLQSNLYYNIQNGAFSYGHRNDLRNTAIDYGM